MMLCAYKQMFEDVKRKHPKNYREIIKQYLDLIFEFYNQKESLAIVEILSLLYRYKDDELNKKVYADIYEKYSCTNFLIRNLTSTDMKYIKERYLVGIVSLGKEYCSVI